MGRIDLAQRRARLARRHQLTETAKAQSPADIARSLVGLHGTDPSTVHLAAAARMTKPDVASVERALYDERGMVRMLGMRRTVFVEALDVAPVVQASCTNAIAVTERRRLIQHLGQFAEGIDNPADWLADVEQSAYEALVARGEALGTELTADDPRLRTKLHYKEGDIAVVTRVLTVLAAEGRIMRGRPRGSWVSSQFRWAPVDRWFPDGMPQLPEAEARVDLVRRYLTGFGPATVADVKWWTGWNVGDVRRALAALDPVEVDLDGEPGIALAGDTEPDDTVINSAINSEPINSEPINSEPTAEPWIALLPALDPTTMGWQRRHWYLGDHGPRLFDTNGNAGPTVWCDGRVVGGWAQRRDGEVVVRLFDDIGAEATAAVQAEAERLTGWLGAARVTPRFRTPLERELTA